MRFFVVLAVALACMVAQAQESCERCAVFVTSGGITSGECRATEVSPSDPGRFGCTDGWPVHECPWPDYYHPSEEGSEFATHCHFSGSTCEVQGPVCTDVDPANGVCDESEWECEDADNDGECDSLEEPGCPPSICGSPLVIKLDGGKYKFSGANDPVLFDLHGYGTKLLWTWTKRGEEVAFLVRDLNGNGQIDSGLEMFGDYAPHMEDRVKINGFITLSWFAGADGFVDNSDAVWSSLRLWMDLNHDGVTDDGELSTLESHGIEWLDTNYRASDREDRHGNELRYKSRLQRNGVKQKYFDVYFRRVN